MKPIGPLMWEHRLIEQIIPLMHEQIDAIRESERADIVFIERAVDFFRTYADRTHHGKEEDILFRDLEKKNLSPEHKKIMNELVEEHIYARKTVGRLLEANQKYLTGDSRSVRDVAACLRELSQLYPKHIEKEDKHFFFPILDYFTKQEQDAMLQEFWEFDKKMIHEKYRNVVAEYSK